MTPTAMQLAIHRLRVEIEHEERRSEYWRRGNPSKHAVTSALGYEASAAAYQHAILILERD